jgi:hypothetical protein
LWTLVQGEANDGVTADTLGVVLLNLIGIKTPDRERVPEETKEEKEIK